MYQNYIFDLYGTLIDIRTDEYSAGFWRKAAGIFSRRGASYTPGELHGYYIKLVRREKIREHLLHPTIRYIDIDLLRVFRKIYLRRGVSPSEDLLLETAERFRTASTEHICLYDGVIDLLDSLRADGKRIFLLSNAQRSFTVPELRRVGLYDYFDGIMISSDERICKPEPAYFRRLLQRYDLDPAESIMIGNDPYSDIRGACSVGMDSLYIHQAISPPMEDEREIRAKYIIMDGDVRKIKDCIL